MDEPKFTDYFNPLLIALKYFGGESNSNQIISYIVKYLELPENILSITNKNGTPRYKNRIYWAKYYLTKSGYIDLSDRKTWKLSDKALRLDSFSDKNISEIVKSVQLMKSRRGNSDAISAHNFDINRIKIAIIDVLKSRPNNSCKRSDLAQEVRLYMALTLNNQSRIEFDHMVTDALSRLKQSNLVLQYKATTNIRVRLNKFKTNNINNLISKWQSETSFSNTNFIGDDMKTNEKSRSIRIPDLGKVEDPEVFLPPDIPNGRDIEEYDENIEDGIKTLTNDTSNKITTDENADLLISISDKLKNIPHLDIKQEFNKIDASFNFGNKQQKFDIIYHPEFTRLTLHSYFNIVNKDVMTLLKFSGHDDFTSVLGIKKISGRLCYVLHKTINLNVFSIENAFNVISQFLTDIGSIKSIIEE